MGNTLIPANKGCYELLASPLLAANVLKISIIGWRVSGNHACPIFAGPQIPSAIIAIPEPGGYVRIVDNGGYMPAADFQAYARARVKK